MSGHVISRIFAFGFAFAGLAGCAAVPPAATTAEFSPPVSAQTLVGSTSQALNANFGQPVLRRTDGPAQVWVYQSAVCGLQVFLYPDAAGLPRVAAAVPDNGNPTGCMQSLARPVTTAAVLEHPATS